MKKLILLSCLFVSFVHASDIAAKRSLMVQTFLENQENIWKITNQLPPDLTIAALGLNFPGITQTELKAKSFMLYRAAQTALLVTKEDLSDLINCKKVFDKYKKSVHAWSTPEGTAKNCPATGNQIQDGVCMNTSLLCRSAILNFEARYESMLRVNQKYTQRRFTPDENELVPLMSVQYWLNSFLSDINVSCKLGTEVKNVAMDFNKTCGTIFTKEMKDSVISHELDLIPKSKTKYENGVVRTDYDNPVFDCKETKPYPKAPLYFAGGGKNIKGYYCEGNHFIGILNGTQEMLLINSRTRAFYWLEMAEKFFEMSKTLIANDKEFSVEKLQGPLKKWTQDGMDSDLMLIGEAYSSDSKLSANEKAAIKRLAQDVTRTRETTLNLKNDVQDLLVTEKFNFGFYLEF